MIASYQINVVEKLRTTNMNFIEEIMTGKLKWVSDRDHCDICKKDISAGSVPFFVDGMIRNSNSEWGLMCPRCFDEHGVGLGVGKGQKFNGDKDAELIDGYDQGLEDD